MFWRSRSDREKFIREQFKGLKLKRRWSASARSYLQAVYNGEGSWTYIYAVIPRNLKDNANYMAALHELGHTKVNNTYSETFIDGLYRKRGWVSTAILANEAAAWEWALATYVSQEGEPSRELYEKVLKWFSTYMDQAKSNLVTIPTNASQLFTNLTRKAQV